MRSKYGVRTNAGKVSERDVLKACLDYLATLPYVKAWRRNTGAVVSEYHGKKRMIRYGRKGMSDIEGMVNGIHLEIEVKAPGKTLTQEQSDWLMFIEKAGGIAFWVDSVELLGFSMRAVFISRNLPWKKEYEL